METIGLVILACVLRALAIWAGWNPKGLMTWLGAFWEERGRISVVVGIRVAIGLYLLAVAEATAAPRLVAGLGAFFLVAAVAVVAMGSARVDRWVEYWTRRSEGAIRGLAVAWVALAAFLFWAGLAPA